jgi:hypothetical protein
MAFYEIYKVDMLPFTESVSLVVSNQLLPEFNILSAHKNSFVSLVHINSVGLMTPTLDTELNTVLKATLYNRRKLRTIR